MITALRGKRLPRKKERTAQTPVGAGTLHDDSGVRTSEIGGTNPRVLTGYSRFGLLAGALFLSKHKPATQPLKNMAKAAAELTRKSQASSTQPQERGKFLT